MKTRCQWATHTEHEKEYHDTEWGVPLHDDRLLFEFLILEGAQAGLSWSTVLAKREGYRKAFDNFEIDIVSKYTEEKIQKLILNPAIIRNKLKIRSTVTNAKAVLKVIDEFGSLDKYLWSFADQKPIKNSWKSINQVPSTSPISDAMSKDLKKRGFKFIGSTICYAFMQATGMVNDHTVDCFRYNEC